LKRSLRKRIGVTSPADGAGFYNGLAFSREAVLA